MKDCQAQASSTWIRSGESCFRSTHRGRSFCNRWLDEALGKLSGRLPFKMIDTNNAASPNLPYIDRPLSQFKSLSHIVRGRHMIEFEKRYSLEGSSNGLDVTHDWSPTMAEAWGVYLYSWTQDSMVFPIGWAWCLHIWRITKESFTRSTTRVRMVQAR